MSCECGCGRPAAPGRPLSWACYKQRKRTGSVRRPHPDKANRHESPEDMLMEAAVAVTAVARGSEDWERTWKRFWLAIRRYQSRNSVHKPTDTTSRG